MQVKMWQHLQAKANQPQWTRSQDAEKFVAAMLELQKAETVRKIAYDIK